jgi:hypothetical protein
MRQAEARREDLRLDAERRLQYKGTACIGLEFLNFRRCESGKENEEYEPDRENVEYLKGCFRKEGCRQVDVGNHIPALIDQQSLDDALQAAGISANQLRSPSGGYPELAFPDGFQLECLHGKDRIQAAREYLSPRNKWWAVDLYPKGMIDIPRQASYLSSSHGTCVNIPLTAAFIRHRLRPENMSDRGVRQRGEAPRWRDLPQDTPVSLSTESQF